mgnify:CR=1 FL=1
MVKQKIINIVGIFFLVIGITLLLYPEIISYLKQKQSDQTVKELTQRRSKRKQDVRRLRLIEHLGFAFDACEI